MDAFGQCNYKIIENYETQYTKYQTDNNLNPFKNLKYYVKIFYIKPLLKK
jgi:hypothetical protein